MKIQAESQLIDVEVRDPDGRPVGRIAAVVCGPDPYTVRWLLVRLRWRRARRAVPAGAAVWNSGTGVQVPFTRAHIAASAAVSAGKSTADRHGADDYYAALTR